jgi:acetyl esterase/lipase
MHKKQWPSGRAQPPAPKDTATSHKLLAQVVPMAIEDGRQALLYVRQHAGEFGISADRIGIMGFSAGGALASTSALDYTPANRPDCAAPIYAYVPPFLPAIVQKDAPPLFIAAATDDEYHLVPMSIALYSKWLAAGRSAELHIYSKGGHGFGMNRQNQPSDTWIDRFGDWLNVQGLHPAWAMIAAFGTYFCMYGLRKPYTAATYSDVDFFGMNYKALYRLYHPHVFPVCHTFGKFHLIYFP